MKQEIEVRVRDKRKPGHCWQDNELYDAWQPIIGPHAVNIYVNLTRNSYSSTIEYSVRRLADATGISRTAVWRNLRVMEHVGMLRLQRGSGSSTSTCELLDLKEAAEKLGAVYNRRQASFVFTDGKLASLRMEVVQLRKSMQSKSPESASSHTVSQRDTNSAEQKILCPSKRDACVPPERRLCLSDGGAQQKCEKNTIHKTNPPLPLPLQGRGDASHATDSPLVSEAERVMRECGWTDSRLLAVIATALKARCDEGDITVLEAGDLMIGNWREYVELGKFLRFVWSPRKWIAHGHWLNWKLWPLDQSRLERCREARVGS